jgi:glutamyl-tRNA reductase
VAAAVHRRRDPLLLVDLGLPRCIDPAASDLPGVFLYDLEALQRMVAGALSHRLEAVPAVEALIGAELEAFRTWRRGRGAVPAIQSMHAWAESIRQAELGWLPEELPADTRKAVDKLTRRLVNRLLGRAAARVVKGASGENPDLPTPEDLRSVFGLEEGEQE